MRIDASSVLPAPSQERVRWFEESYRVKLPPALRSFLHRCNGGVPTGEATFVVNGRERLLERFLPILESPRAAGTIGWYDISVVITQIEDRLIDDDDLVGTNMVPIAALFGGDFLCLDYRADVAEPSVVVWDHEQSEEGAPVVFEVCDSFSDFLVSLQG